MFACFARIRAGIARTRGSIGREVRHEGEQGAEQGASRRCCWPPCCGAGTCDCVVRGERARPWHHKVAAGDETKRVLDANSRPDYREQLEKELKAIADSEMWQAGTVVRSLRPERAAKSKG